MDAAPVPDLAVVEDEVGLVVGLVQAWGTEPAIAGDQDARWRRRRLPEHLREVALVPDDEAVIPLVPWEDGRI